MIEDNLEWLREHCDVCLDSMEGEMWSITIAVSVIGQEFKTGYTVSGTDLEIVCDEAVRWVKLFKRINPSIEAAMTREEGVITIDYDRGRWNE